MAVNVVNPTMERAVKVVERSGRRFALPTFRSLRHGAPAATYTERVRGEEVVSRDLADNALFADWGWA